jgi:PIF1-like helicase
MVTGEEMERTIITSAEQLNNLNDEETALESGPKSAMGKRKAYENLLVQQKQAYDGQCNFTMFNLFTSYSTRTAKSDDKKKLKPPPLLAVNDDGRIILTKNTKKFIVRETVYTRYRQDCVVNQCPYVPLDDSDERSCYSTLLLHTIWPIEGEINVLHGLHSAVECLHRLKLENKYVKNAVESIHNSNVLRSNTGCKGAKNTGGSDEDDGDISIEEDDDILDEDDELSGKQKEVDTPILPSNITDGKHIVPNISARYKEYYTNFIKNSQQDFINKMKAENQINDSDSGGNESQMHTKVTKINNYNDCLAQLEKNVKLLTRKQLQAYEIAAEYINGNKGKQMIMFVSGEGGTGKSFLIALIMEYTNIIHGKQKGLYGSAVALAPTGAAAKVINGHTWQAVYGKGIAKRKKQNIQMASRTAKAVGAKLLGIKLAVLDEISMINLETLYEISERQKEAMLAYVEDENERKLIESQPFGGVHMLFTGDFYQLKPITGEAIYTSNPKYVNSKKGQKIWHDINEYIELTESTRFKNDRTPHMNKFLSGVRKGKVNQFLLNKMNERVMTTVAAAKKQAGSDAIWISHVNKEVNKFNDDDFNEKVKNAACYYRIQALHTPTTQLIDRPDEEQTKALLNIHKVNGSPPYLNLAIGTKVSCTKNLGTQIGKSSGNENNKLFVYHNTSTDLLE